MPKRNVYTSGERYQPNRIKQEEVAKNDNNNNHITCGPNDNTDPRVTYHNMFMEILNVTIMNT